jgi:hypothetical protein
MVRRPTPISLRLRNAETPTQRARALLSRLAHKKLLQDRIKWQATKALISFREMVYQMSPDERARWRTECEMVQSFLEKIKSRGA